MISVITRSENIMNKKIVLIAFAGLIAANLSCTNKPSGQKEQQPKGTDSVTADSVVEVKTIEEDIEEEDSCVSIYKKPLGNGQYRDFFITDGEHGYRFRVFDSSKDKYYDIDFNTDDFLNDGIAGISGFASPDGRYVYVIGDILANSTGWVSTLIIYQVNTQTLKAKLINAVAAWRLETDGFTVASETRCTTPDAEYSYQMDFAFEDITYGFDGKVKHKSKEYPSEEIKVRYGNNTNDVKGLGLIRHSFYN